MYSGLRLLGEYTLWETLRRVQRHPAGEAAVGFELKQVTEPGSAHLSSTVPQVVASALLSCICET